MRKLVFACVLLGLTVLWSMGFSQGFVLTPMESGEYLIHDSATRSHRAPAVPDWRKSERPRYLYGINPDLVLGGLSPSKNWVKIGTSSSLFFEVRLSKDSMDNVWISLINPFDNDDVTPAYLVKGKEVRSVEDLVGVYWVSWYLVPNTKDVYPQLNYVSAE